MDRYTAEQNDKNEKLRKAALTLAFILVFLILFIVIFMVLDASRLSKEKTDHGSVIDQLNNQIEAETLSQSTTADQQNSSIIDVTPTPIVTPTLEITPEPTAEPIKMVEVPYGNPEDFGFDLDKVAEIDSYIQGQVDDGFPGAVLMIAKDGHIVFHKAYGYSKKYDGMSLMNEFENMQTDTMFDLASLSKIYATTFSIMKLVDDGYISLDGKVSDYVSDYTGENKDKVTVQMLLSHNAGYIENYYFYKQSCDYHTLDRDTVYSSVKQIPLDEYPGTEYDYNDLDFILLGMIVEEVSGMRIDEYARVNIYEPLGIENQVTYRPMDIGVEKSDIAATERLGNTRDNSVYFDGIRQYTIQGEVHDENTYYSMDQVSGHAGLFATNYGLTVLNMVLLNGGEYAGVRIYKQETIDNWLRYINNEKYQLGYWNASKSSSRLNGYVSGSTFYHNGWTGTATIVDRENNLSIILLTNKRHLPCPDGKFTTQDFSLSGYTPLIQRVYEALN